MQMNQEDPLQVKPQQISYTAIEYLCEWTTIEAIAPFYVSVVQNSWH